MTLPAGSRVYQAIEMAGGVTEEAEASWLNLAEVLTDGARIYVPDKEEVSGANPAIRKEPEADPRKQPVGWSISTRLPGRN